jgi:hypothetical protein
MYSPGWSGRKRGQKLSPRRKPNVNNPPMKREYKKYRMLCDGEQEWSGYAIDQEYAEFRCFYHEEPAPACRYTLQVESGMKWVSIYQDQQISIN